MNGRVLVICYYFPPLGLGGVGRPLNLYKYLPRHGYECDILTVKPVAYRAYEPELLHGLSTLNVFRSGSYDPQRLLYLVGVRELKHSTIKRGQAVADKYFPDSKIGWVRPAVRRGRRLLRERNYSAIISTSPPVSSHLVGMELAEHSGLMWIADFRDFWTMYKIEESYATPAFIRRGNDLLARIRDNSTLITAVNPAISAYIGRGEVITNGFDLERARKWLAPSDNNTFGIGIPGNFNEERVVEPLLKAVDGVRRSHPELHSRIRFIQVGQVDTDWIRRLFAAHELSDRLDVYGLQKRDRTIEIFSSCHLFYIGLTSDREQGILPQRMFDLAASGRPVLASAAQESEVCRFIQSTHAGFCFDETQAARAAEYLVEVIQRNNTGDFQIRPLSDYAMPYSSDAMAKRFADVLDRLT